MLKFETLGGFREDVLLAQTYTVTSYEGKKFTGVIGSIPKHFTAGVAQNVKISDMTIDVGAASREEALEWEFVKEHLLLQKQRLNN